MNGASPIYGKKAPIVFISGLPGVGKSTASKALAGRFERAAHVESDKLQQLILSGCIWPGIDGISLAAQEQLDLRLRNACLLAQSFSDSGFTAIVDDIVIGDVVDTLGDLLNGRDYYFVMLIPEFAQVKQRWIDMNSPFAEAWDWIDDTIRNKTNRYGLWIDITDLSVDETVDAIVEYIGSVT